MQPQDPNQPTTPQNPGYPQPTPPQNPDPVQPSNQVPTPAAAPDPYITAAPNVVQPEQSSQPAQAIQSAQPTPYEATAANPYNQPPVPEATVQPQAPDPAQYASPQPTPTQFNEPVVTTPVNQMNPDQWFQSDAPMVTTPIEEPKPKRKLLFASAMAMLIIGIGATGWLFMQRSDSSQSAEVAQDVGLAGGAEDERFPTQIAGIEESSSAEATSEQATPEQGNEETAASNSTSSSSSSGNTGGSSTPSSSSTTTAKPQAKKSTAPVVKKAPAYTITCTASSSEKSRVTSALLQQTATTVKAAYNGSLTSLTAWTPASMNSVKGNQTAIQSAYKQLKPTSCVVVASLKANPEGTAYSLFVEFPKSALSGTYSSTIMLMKINGSWRTAAATAPVKK